MRVIKPLIGIVFAVGMTSLTQAQQQGSYSDYYNDAQYDQEFAENVGRSEYSSYDPTINDVMMAPRTGKYRGILPSQMTYEILGPMKAKNGDGHIHIQNWMTKLELWGKETGRWRMLVDGAFRMTWLHGKADADMDLDRLYSIWLTGTVGYRITDKTLIVGSLTPQVSSDMDTWVARDLFLGGNLLLNISPSDKISWTLGVAYAPQLGHTPCLPVIGVDWQMTPTWRLQLQGTRVAAMNKVTDWFSWGPFGSIVSGTWTVKHERMNQRFVWLSYVVGLTANVGLGHFDGADIRFVSDLGFTPYNSARYKSASGRHQLKRYRFDTGAYVRFGVQVEY